MPSLHSLALGSIPPGSIPSDWQDEDERYRPSAAQMLTSNVPFYDEILPTAPVRTPPPGDVSVNPADGATDSVAPVAFAVPPPAASPMAFPRQPDAGLRQMLMALTVAVGVSLGALAADLIVPAVNSTALRASSAQLSAPEIELSAPEIELSAPEIGLAAAAPQAIALPTLTIVIGDSDKAPKAAAPMIQKAQPAATAAAAEPNGDPVEWVPDDV